MENFKFTYDSIIRKAANELYAKINGSKNTIQINSQYRNNSKTVTIGQGVSYYGKPSGNGLAERTYVIGGIDKNAETYTPPSSTQIYQDMKEFMSSFGLDKDVTKDGRVSFFFALNI